ncbi:hypothetical protein BTR25_21855 [Bacillus sp. MRMR6]|nr:hypothetical protein BTR25_21855 [Bacillus sp. MRMR6]
MGLACSCGVRTNPIAVDPDILIGFPDGMTRRGALTLTANICADRPELSTFTASFVDPNIVDNRSFAFTSTTFTTISCEIIQGECTVSITGMGLVTGELTPRLFFVQFIDSPSPLSDTLSAFSVGDFAAIIEVGELQPALTFFGCPTT